MNVVVYLLVITVLAAGLGYLRFRVEKSAASARATTDDHILESNTFETGHSNTWRVPKGPQQYAKIFVPKNRRD